MKTRSNQFCEHNRRYHRDSQNIIGARITKDRRNRINKNRRNKKLKLNSDPILNKCMKMKLKIKSESKAKVKGKHKPEALKIEKKTQKKL